MFYITMFSLGLHPFILSYHKSMYLMISLRFIISMFIKMHIVTLHKLIRYILFHLRIHVILWNTFPYFRIFFSFSVHILKKF